jgi:hypothetical protein
MTFLDDLELRSHTAEGWAVTDAEKMRVLKLARLAEEAMSYIDCEVDDTDEVNDLHRLAKLRRDYEEADNCAADAAILDAVRRYVLAVDAHDANVDSNRPPVPELFQERHELHDTILRLARERWGK